MHKNHEHRNKTQQKTKTINSDTKSYLSFSSSPEENCIKMIYAVKQKADKNTGLSLR